MGEIEITLGGDVINSNYRFFLAENLQANRLESLLNLIRDVEMNDGYPPSTQLQRNESAEDYFIKRRSVFRIFALSGRNNQGFHLDGELAGHVSGDPVIQGHEAESKWIDAVGATDVSQLIEVGTLLVRPSDRNRRLSIDLIRLAVDRIVASGHYAVAATAIDNVKALRALVTSGFHEVAILNDKKGLPFRYLVFSNKLR